MKEPALIIMAAGMGSRYGGLKQIDPVDNEGHIMMEFSAYDAIKAGFKKIVFIIKREIEEEFKSIIGNRMPNHIQVEYVYQELTHLPKGYSVPQDRVKPWGTGHAILCCKDIIDGPFAVINADDYYGPNAFKLIYDYLVNATDDTKYRYAMVGYMLKNTLTDHGTVARGVCQMSDENYLINLVERTQIKKQDSGAAYTEDGKTWVGLPEDSVASMNFWGFSKSILDELESGFIEFLDETLQTDPLKGEYLLPNLVGQLLREDKASVYVLKSLDQWHGVTYKEDKEMVVNAISKLKEDGLYPNKLWENK